MVAVKSNKVFIYSISLTSLHVSARASHLQVNTIVFLGYCYIFYHLLYNIFNKITDIMFSKFSKFTSNMSLKWSFYI
jgi:hypothetical protein